jgi:large subunit ribosomal protein L9
MDVILLERIEKLGHIGDVVKVKNGYARNFLLPRGKALRANEANRKVFEANRSRIEAENEERRKSAEGDARSIEGAGVQLIRQASNTGQLYGSVSARDLAEALAAQGHKIAKNQIVLDRPIKAIGMQEVRVALHPEVSVTIKVNVARSPEAAELQAQGIDVVAQMFEPEAAAVAEEIQPISEPLTEADAAQPEPAADEPAAEAEAAVEDEAEAAGEPEAGPKREGDAEEA